MFSPQQQQFSLKVLRRYTGLDLGLLATGIPLTAMTTGAMPTGKLTGDLGVAIAQMKELERQQFSLKILRAHGLDPGLVATGSLLTALTTGVTTHFTNTGEVGVAGVQMKEITLMVPTTMIVI
jgi:hypothetical protein